MVLEERIENTNNFKFILHRNYFLSFYRPVSPPKPSPPPPAPVAVVPAPVIAPIAPIVVALPAPIEISQPIVSIPVESTPATSWNIAPSPPGPLDAWNSTPIPQQPVIVEAALGVGEGWADTITATRINNDNQSNEVKAHLPPNDIATAGPIATSTPPAVVESNSIESSGPPGLSKRVSTTAAPARTQQEAVVLPTTLGSTPNAVQFGSLSLFDGQQGFATGETSVQESAPQQQQQK